MLLFANTFGSITATDATDSEVASMLHDLEVDRVGSSVAVALSKLRDRGYVLQTTHFHNMNLVFVLEKDFRTVIM